MIRVSHAEILRPGAFDPTCNDLVVRHAISSSLPHELERDSRFPEEVKPGTTIAAHTHAECGADGPRPWLELTLTRSRTTPHLPVGPLARVGRVGQPIEHRRNRLAVSESGADRGQYWQRGLNTGTIQQQSLPPNKRELRNDLDTNSTLAQRIPNAARLGSSPTGGA